MGPGYPFGPAAHAQLREEIGDMSFDRVHADRKLVRNFLIGRSLRRKASTSRSRARQSRCGSQRVGKSARLLKRRMLRPLGSKCQNGRGELARIAGFENVRVSETMAS